MPRIRGRRHTFQIRFPDHRLEWMEDQCESKANQFRDIRSFILFSYIKITTIVHAWFIIAITAIHRFVAHSNNPGISGTIFRFVCFLSARNRAKATPLPLCVSYFQILFQPAILIDNLLEAEVKVVVEFCWEADDMSRTHIETKGERRIQWLASEDDRMNIHLKKWFASSP